MSLGPGQPLNVPSLLAQLTGLLVVVRSAYDQAYSDPSYTGYRKFTEEVNKGMPIGYNVITQPMAPMRRWVNDRPRSVIKSDGYESSVARFGDSIEFDAFELATLSQYPMRAAMFAKAVQRFAAAQAALRPSLAAEALVNAYGTTWPIDGQPILGLHYYNPAKVALGQYRNYRANNVQGGSAVYPLTYANLLALLNEGDGHKNPEGFPYPQRYSVLAVPPGKGQLAKTLCTSQWLPAADVLGQVAATSNAGGQVPNQIAMQYQLEPVEVAGMPADMWSLHATRRATDMSMAEQVALDVTWQWTTGSDGNIGVSLEGSVSPEMFRTGKLQLGPVARVAVYVQSPWAMYVCDGANSPTTTLTLV